LIKEVGNGKIKIALKVKRRRGKIERVTLKIKINVDE
jgi:hypothetical protein